MEKHHWSEARKITGSADTDYESANAPKHPRELVDGYVPVDEVQDPNTLSPEEAYSLKEELRDNPNALDDLI